MIRIGRYDAFEKWTILSRSWKDPASVPDPGLDKFGRQRLKTWHQAAVRAGRRACESYIRARVDGMSGGRSDDALLPSAGQEDPVGGEIGQFVQRVGQADLVGQVIDFAETIPSSGSGALPDGGFSPALADRLRQVFEAGALQALRWTDEAGEVPTVEILREHAAGSFPVGAVENKQTVLSLFSARFYGRSDVILIHDARPAHVTLVDLDQSSLEAMKLIYPKGWTYIHQDFETFLREADQRGLSYDLVVSDPFSPYGRVVAFDLLPLIARLCTDTFITNYFDDMFQALAIRPGDREGLARAILAKTGIDVDITDQSHRGGGVYWVVMRMTKHARASNARHGAFFPRRGNPVWGA